MWVRERLGAERVSERRACQVLGQVRSTQRRERQIPDDEARLVARMVELATQYGRYGYRRVTAILHGEGWKVNPKRVERLWRQEGLKVPSRQPKRRRWSSGTNRAVPFSQVTSTVQTVSDDNIIRRLDRMRAIKAQADQAFGTSETLRTRIAPAIEAIELPAGYQLEWQGEYKSSRDGQAALASKIPPIFVFMILVVILLFDRLKQPAIIYLTVPLAIIGVTVGLLLTKQPFGFMALLGILSLSGMLIKNSIMLIDETDGLIREGMDRYKAVVQAGVSRSRPVAMAALTTMLGMIPLFQDAFFVALAVTIVFGLGFATVLTLIVVPVLYAVFFRIPNPDGRRRESVGPPGGALEAAPSS